VTKLGVELLTASVISWTERLELWSKILTPNHDAWSQSLLDLICCEASAADLGDPVFITQPSNFWRLRVRPYQNEGIHRCKECHGICMFTDRILRRLEIDSAHSSLCSCSRISWKVKRV
jgi:hypothetical protein